MRAAKTSTGFWHWHHPDGLHTLCGRALISMRIERELEHEHVPADGSMCVPCEAVRQGDDYVQRVVHLRPTHGFVRKTGPLEHGLKTKRGRSQLWPDGGGS